MLLRRFYITTNVNGQLSRLPVPVVCSENLFRSSETEKQGAPSAQADHRPGLGSWDAFAGEHRRFGSQYSVNQCESQNVLLCNCCFYYPPREDCCEAVSFP